MKNDDEEENCVASVPDTKPMSKQRAAVVKDALELIVPRAIPVKSIHRSQYFVLRNGLLGDVLQNRYWGNTRGFMDFLCGNLRRSCVNSRET